MKKIIIPVLLIALLTAACVSDDVKGARDGDLQAVKDYIQGGGDVNERKSRGMTLLMYASAGGHVHIIDYLMSVGADIRIRDDRGYTAFLHGASAGRNNSMDSLLSYGAGLNDRDNGGRTALILAAYQDSYNTAVFLLDRGADSGTADSGGYTALLASLDKSASQSSGFSRVFSLLQERGEGFSIGDGPVRDIAFKAARSGNGDVLDLLFDKGLDRNIRGSGGETLLHGAAAWPVLLDSLMARGLDMNDTNNRNETPLMTAVGQGYAESVLLLLQRGARTDIRSNSGRTALLLASEKTNLEVLRALILAGADIYSNDGKGNTALHFAAAKGTADMVRLLLTAGIYVNSANGEGKTPYDMSFQNKDRGEEIRAVLVTAGAIVPQPPAEAAAAPEAPPAETEGTVMAETNLPKAPIQGQAQAKPAPVTAAASKPVVAETATPSPSEPIPPESAPAEPPAGPAVKVLSLSWPMINPSKAEGWSNRDKLTGKGRFVYALPGQDSPLFTREFSFPLQGVNIKEGVLEQEFPWDGSSPAVIRMILDTNQGRTLTAEIPLGAENGAGPVRFEKFLYK